MIAKSNLNIVRASGTNAGSRGSPYWSEMAMPKFVTLRYDYNNPKSCTHQVYFEGDSNLASEAESGLSRYHVRRRTPLLLV